MPALACLQCRCFFRPKRNGVIVEEGMPQGDSDGPWVPYKLWVADLYECPNCGVQVIGGFGWHPIAEHFQENYNAMREANPPMVRIDDCGGMKP